MHHSRCKGMGICTPLILLALTAMLLSACDEGLLGTGEKGSGNLVTETREVDTFTAIELSGAMELDLIVDPNAEQSVMVTYDDNIIDRVVTRVSGDTLVLALEGNVNLTGGADRLVTVTMNELTGLQASGATDVEATGATKAYRLDASGASTVLARSLDATDIDLDVSGASTVAVYATGTVRGSLSGASNLDVYGEPVSVLVDSSGASDLDIKN